MEITFDYGLMAKTFEQQANEQGYTFDANAAWVEDIVYGLKCAYFHECITDSEYEKITERVTKKILVENLKRLRGKAE